MTDISAVLNAHTEGQLLVPSVRSFLDAVAWAREAGIGVEAFVIGDRTDTDTQTVLKDNFPDLEVVYTDHGDLGLARNTAVGLAKGKYVAFLDADDLWCRSWLADAFLAAQRLPERFVAHPQWWVGFNNQNYQLQLVEHIGSIDPRFAANDLVQNNPWTALCFAPRAVLVEFPYKIRKPGVGFEDWQFNLTTYHAGVQHVVVPKTVHFIRGNVGRKSLSGDVRAEGGVVGSHPFYERRPALGNLLGTSVGPIVMSEINKKWLADRIEEANGLEPRLWPQRGRPLNTWVVPRSAVAEPFWRLQEAAGHDANVVVVMTDAAPRPTLLKAIEDAFRISQECYFKLPPTFIMTQTDAERVPLPEAQVLGRLQAAGCGIIFWRQYDAGLSTPENIFMMQKFIVQNQFLYVMCLDDPLLTGALRANAKAITLASTVDFYCEEPGVIDGRPWSPALEHLPDIRGALDEVFCATEELRTRLQRTYGLRYLRLI